MDDLKTTTERKRCVDCVLSQLDLTADPVVKSLLFRIANLIESGDPIANEVDRLLVKIDAILAEEARINSENPLIVALITRIKNRISVAEADEAE